jgi:SNF2 family DNA or RNA helicase
VSALAEAPGFIPARELPNGAYVYSPLGVFDFQADGVAEAYVRTQEDAQSGVLAVWDTGIGKTWLAMVLAAYLFEDGLIDQVMVFAERGKIRDWQRDFERATAMSVHLYHGTGRQKRLAKAGSPHVFITTYETGRNELVEKYKEKGKRGLSRKDGPLMDTLGLRGKRTLWVLDEITAKLRTRGSELHQAFAYVLGQTRKGPHHQRVLGLTGTPIERDMADSYNIGRIVCPELMPTVAKFEETFTKGKDPYNHYVFQPGTKHAFAHLFRDIVMRKSKRDQDVIDQFPKQVEVAWHVPLAPDHAKFYDAVATLLDPEDGEELAPEQQRKNTERLWNAVRMSAGHPASHLHGHSEISRTIVDTVGEEGLRAIASSKTDELITRLKPIVKGQGAQVVIFTFYGNTVLKELGKDLRKAGYVVGEFHGGKSAHANDDAQEQFKIGNTEILLCSDAAARGLNLGNAEYVIEYESAITYANRLQRINRAHRIDSSHPLVTCITMVAEGTVEEGIIDRTMERNKDHDLLVGDDEDGSNVISAAQRRQMLAIKRRRR